MKAFLKIFTLLLCLSLCFVFLGCQNVFTTSPFKDLFKPDVAKIPPEQLANYGQDVLANGSDTEREAAYVAITTAIAAGNKDPELNYVAASLALDQIDFTIEAVMNNLSDPVALQNMFMAEGVLETLMDTGGYLYTASEGGVELTGTDNLIGGVGLLLSTVPTINDVVGIDWNAATSEQNAALDMIQTALPAFEIDVSGEIDLASLLMSFMSSGI